MTVRVAINGFGRIGRLVLRALEEQGRKDIEIVALNNLSDAQTNAHLLKYDSAHGRFSGDVQIEGDDLVVNGRHIKSFASADPTKIEWGALNVDVVMECSGFSQSAKAR